jgi:hypothetical protein
MTTADLTRLNKASIARQVRAYRASHPGTSHKQIVEGFEYAWACSSELTAEQIAHASAFVEVVLAEDDARIAQGKREIRADIERGVVPADVMRFAELHDYVDANGYGGMFETDLDGEELVDAANIVQNALDDWMGCGGHCDA